MKLEVPDSVVEGMRLPEPEVRERLLRELAIALYAQQVLSFGKARQLAGLDHIAFGRLLAERGIARHYTEDDLSDDVAYAHRQ
jgi:predicted HTH domain antitoxin